MSDFKAKMHKIRLPRQRFARPLAVFKGPAAKGRAGEEGGEGKGEEEKRRGSGGGEARGQALQKNWPRTVPE